MLGDPNLTSGNRYPPCVQRWVVGLMLGWCTMPLLLVVGVIAGANGSVPGARLWAAIALTVFFLALGGTWWALWRVRQIVRTAGSYDGVACLGCAYDLRGAAAKGACPECGAAFEKEALAREWAPSIATLGQLPWRW